MRALQSPYNFVLVLGALSASGLSVEAQETGEAPRYYMAVFAYQAAGNLPIPRPPVLDLPIPRPPVLDLPIPGQPQLTHTFATFVKSNSKASSAAKPGQSEFQTISWMPATLDVRLVRFKPEPGINLDLPSSLRLAKSSGAKVSMWGPYEIKKELYDRGAAQVARLKQKGMAYKALDRRYRGGDAFNCIHAVSDIDVDAGYLDTGTASGEAASQLVVNHLRRWIIDPEKVHDSITKELGLAEDSIVRRGMVKEAVKP